MKTRFKFSLEYLKRKSVVNCLVRGASFGSNPWNIDTVQIKKDVTTKTLAFCKQLNQRLVDTYQMYKKDSNPTGYEKEWVFDRGSTISHLQTPHFLLAETIALVTDKSLVFDKEIRVPRNITHFALVTKNLKEYKMLYGKPPRCKEFPPSISESFAGNASVKSVQNQIQRQLYIKKKRQEEKLEYLKSKNMLPPRTIDYIDDSVYIDTSPLYRIVRRRTKKDTVDSVLREHIKRMKTQCPVGVIFFTKSLKKNKKEKYIPVVYMDYTVFVPWSEYIKKGGYSFDVPRQKDDESYPLLHDDFDWEDDTDFFKEKEEKSVILDKTNTFRQFNHLLKVKQQLREQLDLKLKQLSDQLSEQLPRVDVMDELTYEEKGEFDYDEDDENDYLYDIDYMFDYP